VTHESEQSFEIVPLQFLLLFSRDELPLLFEKYGMRNDELQTTEVLREAILEASPAQLGNFRPPDIADFHN
jgi:hypothetical protein